MSRRASQATGCGLSNLQLFCRWKQSATYLLTAIDDRASRPYFFSCEPQSFGLPSGTCLSSRLVGHHLAHLEPVCRRPPAGHTTQEADSCTHENQQRSCWPAVFPLQRRTGEGSCLSLPSKQSHSFTALPTMTLCYPRHPYTMNQGPQGRNSEEARQTCR